MINTYAEFKKELRRWQTLHYQIHETHYNKFKEQNIKKYEDVVALLKVYWKQNKESFKELSWSNYAFENLVTDSPTSLSRMHLADCLNEFEHFTPKEKKPNAELVCKQVIVGRNKKTNNKSKK